MPASAGTMAGGLGAVAGVRLRAQGVWGVSAQERAEGQKVERTSTARANADSLRERQQEGRVQSKQLIRYGQRSLRCTAGCCRLTSAAEAASRGDGLTARLKPCPDETSALTRPEVSLSFEREQTHPCERTSHEWGVLAGHVARQGVSGFRPRSFCAPRQQARARRCRGEGASSALG